MLGASSIMLASIRIATGKGHCLTPICGWFTQALCLLIGVIFSFCVVTRCQGYSESAEGSSKGCMSGKGMLVCCVCACICKFCVLTCETSCS